MAELSKEAIANIAMRVGMPSFYPDELAAFAQVCYEAGRVAGIEDAAKVVEAIEARCIAKDVDDPPLAHVSAAIRARGVKP